MGWRDHLRPASYRGVPFYTLPVTTQIGRRHQIHEYPQRDRPYVEDLGRKARQYQVDAVVLGAEYMAARDLLIAALEAKGPGRLIHPTLGEIDVSVASASCAEDTAKDGGCARFSLSFVEDGGSPALSVTTDTSKVAAAAADKAVVASQQAYIEQTALVPDASALGEAAAAVDTSTLGAVMEAIDTAVAAVAAVNGAVNEVIGEVTALANDAMRIVDDAVAFGEGLVADILSLPGSLLADASSLVSSVIGDAGPVLDILSDVVGLLDPTDDLTRAAAASGTGAARISEVPALAARSAITDTRASLSGLATSPTGLGGAMVGVVRSFVGTGGLSGGTTGGFGIAGAGASRISSTALARSPMLAIADAMPAADGTGGTVDWDALPTGVVATVTKGAADGETVAGNDTSGATILTAQANNRQALGSLVRQVAVIEAVRVATDATTRYATADDALAVRDTLAVRLDAEMQASASHTLTAALRDLRSALVEDTTARAAVLPALETVTATTVLPALVIASQIHDDPDRAGEIVARNRITHPGFVPVGQLTVLSA